MQTIHTRARIQRHVENQSNEKLLKIYIEKGHTLFFTKTHPIFSLVKKKKKAYTSVSCTSFGRLLFLHTHTHTHKTFFLDDFLKNMINSQYKIFVCHKNG
mmetsp:Transcript_3431/g.4640  ORF Transcript_3431/g.4640 Transcript_3431/m.4640 type:complete len:100 (+) Transcript_3431:509-808(+)